MKLGSWNRFMNIKDINIDAQLGPRMAGRHEWNMHFDL